MNHHAYLYIGDRYDFRRFADLFLSKQGIERKGNIDVSIQVFDFLGVDDARMIKEAAYRTASRAGAQSWHVMYIGGATHEAQNALLKILEEPPKNTFFLIGVAHEEVLLPTVRSRLLRLSDDPDTLSEQSEQNTVISESLGGDAENDGVRERDDVQRFVSASLPERLSIVKPYYDDKEPIPSAYAFLDALERACATQMRENPNDVVGHSILHTCISAREYLYGRSPSKKLLLENLALQLPSNTQLDR